MHEPPRAMEPHRWKFIRTGGVDQVVISSGADIVNLERLDQKLWVALACPTRGLELDPRTLDLIDIDRDGRVRAPEVVDATRWVRAHFRDPDLLLEDGDGVALDAIRSDTEAGARLARTAQRILALTGKPQARTIALSDLADLQRHLAAERFNGDGVVPPSAAQEPRARWLIERIRDTHGPVADLSGEGGIDRARAEAFFGEVEALQAWQREAQRDCAVMPLRERTIAALDAWEAVRAKVEDYFARCALATYDRVAAPALSPAVEAYRALAQETLTRDQDAIARLPLASIDAHARLPLREGLNPAWRARMETFRTDAAEPLLGPSLDALAESEWRELCALLAPCAAWRATKPEGPAARLPMAEVMAIGPQDEAAVLALLAEDEALADERAQAIEVERLLRYRRDLAHLLNNFVSFAEFYHGRGAIFEAGTLYLDARSCDLTVQVSDPAKHPALAGLAKAFLAYCECRRGGETMHIVAAITAGDTDFLLVGRNGLFYDRSGNDWDATITKVIENPISIAQAFYSPYKKLSRMIEEAVARRAAASEGGVQQRLGALAGASIASAGRPIPAGPGVPARRIDVGTVAALGVALGSISTVLVGIFASFIELGWWIPVALAGIVSAISGPSMLIAWLKLRQRSLGPILDASGWAINGRMRINVPLGRRLSKKARLPRNAERSLYDPLVERHVGLWLALCTAVLLGALVFAYRQEWLDHWLAPAIQFRTVAPTAPQEPRPGGANVTR